MANKLAKAVLCSSAFSQSKISALHNIKYATSITSQLRTLHCTKRLQYLPKHPSRMDPISERYNGYQEIYVNGVIDEKKVTAITAQLLSRLLTLRDGTDLFISGYLNQPPPVLPNNWRTLLPSPPPPQYSRKSSDKDVDAKSTPPPANPLNAIHLIINSRETAVSCALALYDIIRGVQCFVPVTTTSLGSTKGLSTLLLAMGTPGMRQAYPNSQILLRQPMANRNIPILPLKGSTVAGNDAKESKFVEEKLIRLLYYHCGAAENTEKKKILDKSLVQNLPLTPTEALGAGIIDRIVPSIPCYREA